MTETLVIIIVALLVGLAKGGFGPVGGLIVPVLSTQMPVSDAVGLALPLLIVGDWFAMRAYWRKWDTRHIKLLLPGAVVGIVFGLALLTSLSDDTLRRVLGVFTLIVAAYKLASDSLANLAYTPRDWHGTLAGSTAGFASALANAGDPPITSYLLLQRLAPMTFVATNVLFFATVNLLKLPAFLVARVLDVHELIAIAWVLPLIPVGVGIGRYLINRISPKLFEWLMFGGLVWAGLMLLLG
jgi:uncharacterized membrane protein YfcA